MITKYFTPAQANRTLPLVRRIVSDILVCGGQLRALATAPRLDRDDMDRIDDLKAEIMALMGELEDIGCSYRDWNFTIGLVDFPARVDGEDALLCWRSDEARITWYHGVDAGFAGRRPIPAYLLEDDPPPGEGVDADAMRMPECGA